MADDERFAQIVSIGAHDLSTPLATVYGFAKTLPRPTSKSRRRATSR